MSPSGVTLELDELDELGILDELDEWGEWGELDELDGFGMTLALILFKRLIVTLVTSIASMDKENMWTSGCFCG